MKKITLSLLAIIFLCCASIASANCIYGNIVDSQSKGPPVGFVGIHLYQVTGDSQEKYVSWTKAESDGSYVFYDDPANAVVFEPGNYRTLVYGQFYKAHIENFEFYDTCVMAPEVKIKSGAILVYDLELNLYQVDEGRMMVIGKVRNFSNKAVDVFVFGKIQSREGSIPAGATFRPVEVRVGKREINFFRTYITVSHEVKSGDYSFSAKLLNTDGGKPLTEFVSGGYFQKK